ncbi:hypothetical protein V8G54_005330 [Vigna mungo]|uniref:Retrovirus-related Pol polyprotein from transposon TNT 1-94 n=1 Tax=Vigna mungo TaxID=3915 RepID=A0AAQ3P193_VIGMU
MASISQTISSTPDHLVNPANPLYLHPGENLALVLVSPLLTESNFHKWERDMVVALETKNKERFIHGTLPCPPITDPLYEAWRRSNRMVMSWLTRSMTPSIKQSRDLKDRFSHVDKFRIFDLQDQILACRQGESTVSEYYTKLKILWKEMELYRCVLTCTCLTPCVCGLLSKLHKEREDDYVIRFLRGLNDNYAQVRSQIMMLDPMPSIVKTFSMILQHEHEFIGILPKPFVPDSLAFAALSTDPRFPSFTRPTSATSKTISRNNKFCEHCKKTNHTIENCYFRIGFPVGYKKSKPTTKTSASLVTVDPSASSQPLNLDGNPTNDQFTFSKDQYQAILALLQHTKDHSSSVNHASVHNLGTSFSFAHWIIDSGATDHICPIKSLFHNLHPITPIHINLPNHTIVIASFSGTIHIGALLLVDVLFVHEFSRSHLTMIGATRKVDGIFHETSCLESPQQNEIFERKHQHILNVARALLFQSHLPSVFWSYAIKHVVHLINRLPTPFLKHQSPYQYVFGSLLDFQKLRVFGCLAFSNTIMAGRTKLDKRASKCIFLGFKPGVKGYLLYNLHNKNFLVSRNVIFYESHFPYAHESQSISHHHNTGLTASQQIFYSLIAFDIPVSGVSSLNTGTTDVEPVMQFNNDSNNVVQTINPLPRVSNRQRKPPAYLSTYDCPTLSSTNISYSTPYPLHSYLSYSSCSNSHTAFCMSLSATIEPSSFKEACQHDHWQQAMIAEIQTLFLISIIVSRHWSLYQLDVDNAFLHGDLNEDVYMKPPPGLLLPEPHLVCKLHKSLYGLRQASRQWNSKLTSALISYGFSQSSADHSLFTYHSSNSFIALLVYVDDIVLTGDNMQAINDVKQFLHHKFSIKDLGSLKFFLGFEVARSQQGLVLNQRKYCLEILSEFGLTSCKPATSPSNPTIKLKDDEGDLVSDPTAYRRLIGKPQYLTNTRPDISFVVQQVSQFMSKPRQSHLHAAFRILRYLKSCPGLGLFYPSSNPHRIQAFSDSDWATCSLTRKSITGYCVFYGHCLISWKSKKQSTVSRSSTEAEYRALASVACELQWLKYIADDLRLKIPLPFPTFCDNQSAIQLAKNPSFHERTKHIEVDCHLIRAKILDGLIVISHVPSKHQLADMLTKSLYPGPFHDNLSKMGLLNIHHPS